MSEAESRRLVIPLSLAGKWVAFSADGREIIATASSPEVAEKRARAAGHDRVAIDRIPKGRRFERRRGGES